MTIQNEGPRMYEPKKWGNMLYLVSLTLAATLLLSGLIGPTVQAPEIRVVSEAVAPAYPQIALLAGLGGSVFVDVDVNRSGTVESVKVASGASLLSEAAEKAAKSWRFASGGASKVSLEFQFTVMPRGTIDADLTTRFRSPVTIEVRGIIPQVESYTIRDVGEGKR